MTASSGFSADWLALREPFDAAARAASPRLLQRLQSLRRTNSPTNGPWRVLDLGCGSGANSRWLAPRLGGAQQWLALDHDAALLRAWPVPAGARPGPGGRLHWRGAGFRAELLRQQTELAHALDALPWQAAQLVTASALLDLVGPEWLAQLVRHATKARAALLFALIVDGRHEWAPADADDARVGALFAAHQRRDKGLGPALGAQAVPWLARALRARGYRVQTARSDWRLGASDVAMQRALIEGMASAAIEQDPAQAPRVNAWRDRRLALLGRATLRVGHRDLLAWPAR